MKFFFEFIASQPMSLFKDKWTMQFKEHTGPWSVSCAQNITMLDKQNGVYKSEITTTQALLAYYVNFSIP